MVKKNLDMANGIWRLRFLHLNSSHLASPLGLSTPGVEEFGFLPSCRSPQPMSAEHEVEGSRSIHGLSGQTIADAEHQVTEETVDEAVWTVCATRWCYSLRTVN